MFTRDLEVEFFFIVVSVAAVAWALSVVEVLFTPRSEWTDRRLLWLLLVLLIPLVGVVVYILAGKSDWTAWPRRHAPLVTVSMATCAVVLTVLTAAALGTELKCSPSGGATLCSNEDPTALWSITAAGLGAGLLILMGGWVGDLLGAHNTARDEASS